MLENVTKQVTKEVSKEIGKAVDANLSEAKNEITNQVNNQIRLIGNDSRETINQGIKVAISVLTIAGSIALLWPRKPKTIINQYIYVIKGGN